MSSLRKFIDIGANLTDAMYRGIYNGSQKHKEDLQNVLQRSWNSGLEKIIITGGSISDAETALKIAQLDDRLYSTVGCHPTRCKEFEDNPQEYFESLKNLILTGGKKIAAIGECGLDYDRTQFCDKETQRKYFEEQLKLCDEVNLPLFLHCRAAWDDFFEILTKDKSKSYSGVVHSFDGSLDNMKKAVELGFFIGINGCSLKTAENLDVVSKIPQEYILLETDCPWCEVRPTHAGAEFIKTKYPSVKKEKFDSEFMIKGRNEPNNIVQVLEIIAAVRNEDADLLSEIIYQNTNRLFFK